MIIRRLAPRGIALMQEFLASLTRPDPLPYPASLLFDPETSEALSHDLQLEPREYRNRLEAGVYLLDRIRAAGLTDWENDRGLWAWLALFYFENLCTVSGSGRWKPGAAARWIPEPGFRRYYRHLLLGPVRLVLAHSDDPERALCVLAQPVNKPGDVVEQLASRQEIVTNKTIVRTATRLYVNAATKRIKRGAGGKGGGSPRHLVVFLAQLDVTWDLYSLEPTELEGMLPWEFDKFRPEPEEGRRAGAAGRTAKINVEPLPEGPG